MPDAIEVRKVPLHSVSDASEMTKLIDAGVLNASRVIAIIGKTEGNGGVNDYTRIIADRAFREVLVDKGAPADQVKQQGFVTSCSRRDAMPAAPSWCYFRPACLTATPCRFTGHRLSHDQSSWS